MKTETACCGRVQLGISFTFMFQTNNAPSTSADLLQVPALRRGDYPSIEKLNDEIHSEPRIYEKQEEIQRVIIDEHKARNQMIRIRTDQLRQQTQLPRVSPSNHLSGYQRQYNPQRACYNSAPRLLTTRRISYAASAISAGEHHQADYSPWQRASSTASGPTIGRNAILTWQPHALGSGSQSLEILHV